MQEASYVPDTTFDLTNPQTVILSLYQDYPWKIIAKQPIDRHFVVEGQIGEAVFYVSEKERRAIAYVSKEQDLSKIKIKELKLGPTGSTIHGYDGNSTVMNFTGGQPQIVIVTYRDILEDWTLNVFETDAVKITSADGWVNVAWLYGEGLEGEDNGFEIREATSEEWQKVDASYMITTGGSFSARIPHLKASTAYVCRAYSGTSISTEKTFTTTAAIELPNASFDYWSMDGKVANPWEENSTPFWDTGNIGVTTASQSNSTPTDDTAAGSGKAARLESENVILKFAAGNPVYGKIHQGGRYKRYFELRPAIYRPPDKIERILQIYHRTYYRLASRRQSGLYAFPKLQGKARYMCHIHRFGRLDGTDRDTHPPYQQKAV